MVEREKVLAEVIGMYVVYIRTPSFQSHHAYKDDAYSINGFLAYLRYLSIYIILAESIINHKGVRKVYE